MLTPHFKVEQSLWNEGGHLVRGGGVACGRSRGGFSLIELLVVISIIMLMLGFGVVGFVRYMSTGVESQTRVVLKQLANVAGEYQGDTKGQTVPYTGGYPTGSADDSISKFFTGISGSQSAVDTSILIAEDFSGAAAGSKPSTVKDGWGNAIRYYPGGSIDATGKGLPRRDMPYFASAGADGEWGTVNPATGEPNNGAAKDNLYSFEAD